MDHEEEGVLASRCVKVCQPHFRHASSNIVSAENREKITRCSDGYNEG